MNSDSQSELRKPRSTRPERQNIRERSFAYALRAIRLYRHVETRRDGAAKILCRQYLRAACSVGANIEEAQSAESRADFVHKLSVAQKEARESCFWLRLLAESESLPKSRLKPLLEETEELNAVITTIILKTKRGSKPESVTRHS